MFAFCMSMPSRPGIEDGADHVWISPQWQPGSGRLRPVAAEGQRTDRFDATSHSGPVRTDSWVACNSRSVI